jgi:hypothetical protein
VKKISYQDTKERGRSFPAQSQKMFSSQSELNNHWTKVSKKRGRPTQEETERNAEQAKESEHWLKQTFTSNHYTALLEEESEDQQQKASPGNAPKPSQIYITDVTNISPLIRLLEQITKQQYETEALTDIRVKVQPRASDSYRTITKNLSQETHGISKLQIKRRKKL